ncbi:MAG: hypothetical protein LC115_06780 [Bacteroidia bacterium]|nr:hypothetical protein [Bacteroidia bacterium]
MNRIFIILLVINLTFKLNSDAQNVTVEPKVNQLLNDLIRGLQVQNIEESEKIVLGCVHSSLKTEDGKRLIRDVFEYSFQKAHEVAALYQYPVLVARMREKGQTTVGHEPNTEQGRIVEYYLSKKSKDNGLPAPVQVFFPASGGNPTIYYLGGL